MIGERPGVKGGHNCKTRASNLHLSMDVTAALSSLFFRIKDFVSHNFFQYGYDGKMELLCHVSEYDKKGQISPGKFLQWLGNTWQYARSHYPERASATLRFGSTAIFTLVVSSAVLLDDVSARAGDVSMGIAVVPIG